MKEMLVKIRPAALAASLLIASHAHAVGTGTIADGTGSISKNGRTTTVNQSSDKLIVNWDNMSVNMGETLTFAQKNATSAVLNRINSADATSILGTLNANGRVFIVNPNGVLIGTGARINVGSLIASSLNISDDDFKADRLNFSGGGQGDVINRGRINATESVGLIGSKTVENTGTIRAEKGDIALASADDVSLTFYGSHLGVKLNKASLDALINNGGLITTVDGNIMLTAWARDSLTRSVINNTGVLEASSLTKQWDWLEGDVPVFGSVSLESRGGGAVTVSGSTYSENQVKVSADTMSIDGTIVGDNGIDLNARIQAKSTDNAVMQTPLLYLRGDGDFDLARGTIATDILFINNVRSADISLDNNVMSDYIMVTSTGVKNDLQIRSKQRLYVLGSQVSGLNVGGNLDLFSQGNITLGLSKVGGNATISAKSYNAVGGDSSAFLPTIIAGGDVTVATKEAYGSGTGVISGYGGFSGNNIRVTSEGTDQMILSNIFARGNVDIANQGAVSLANDITSGGNITFRATSVRDWIPQNPPPLTVRAGGDIAINVGGGSVSLVGNLIGNSVEVSGGSLSLGQVQSVGNTYLRGTRSVELAKRAITGGNLVLESQGDVALAKGATVFGNLTYKLASKSKVSNGEPIYVIGETTGLPQ